MPVEVYRWSDGSSVSIVVDDGFPYFLASLLGVVSSLRPFELRIDKISPPTKGTPHLEVELHFSLPVAVQRRLAAFALDLGVRQIGFLGLIENKYNEEANMALPAPWPVFVPDGAWADRYQVLEQAKGRLLDVDPVRVDNYLLPGMSVDLYRANNGLMYADLTDESSWDSIGTPASSSIREALEHVLKESLIQPESNRSVWEKELDRGVFVCPSPDEVEMYRALGEPLPLLWDVFDLRRWLGDRT